MTTTTTTETETDWLLSLFDALPPPVAQFAPLTRDELLSRGECCNSGCVNCPYPAAERPACSRCSGTGRIPNFSHIKGGECFRCRGTGRGS